jgi:hypothetical protein
LRQADEAALPFDAERLRVSPALGAQADWPELFRGNHEPVDARQILL